MGLLGVGVLIVGCWFLVVRSVVGRQSIPVDSLSSNNRQSHGPGLDKRIGCNTKVIIATLTSLFWLIAGCLPLHSSLFSCCLLVNVRRERGSARPTLSWDSGVH